MRSTMASKIANGKAIEIKVFFFWPIGARVSDTTLIPIIREGSPCPTVQTPRCWVKLEDGIVA
jgi:hypothetical protein